MGTFTSLTDIFNSLETIFILTIDGLNGILDTKREVLDTVVRGSNTLQTSPIIDGILEFKRSLFTSIDNIGAFVFQSFGLAPKAQQYEQQKLVSTEKN